MRVTSLFRHTKSIAVAAIVIVYALTALTVVHPQPAQAIAIPTPARAEFFGDSIMYESYWHMVSQFTKKKGWTYNVTAYPGFALCDWLSAIDAKLATKPSVLVIESQGNSLTSCMKDVNGVNYPYGSTGWLNKYKADFDHVFASANANGVKVLVVYPLPFAIPSLTTASNQLTSMIKTEAAKYHNISVTAAPRNAVTSSGKFIWEKSCLASEGTAVGCDPVTHKIKVRSSDGVHLCPLSQTPADFLNGCPQYSSGEFRYAKALVAATVSPPAPLLP